MILIKAEALQRQARKGNPTLLAAALVAATIATAGAEQHATSTSWMSGFGTNIMTEEWVQAHGLIEKPCGKSGD